MSKGGINVVVIKRTKLVLRFFAVFAIITIVIFSFITSNIISFGSFEGESFHGIFLRREEDSTSELLEIKSQSLLQEEEYKLLNIETKSQNVSVFLKLLFSSYLKNVTRKENDISSITLKIRGPSSNNIGDSIKPPVIDIKLIINNNGTNVTIQPNEQNINFIEIPIVITQETGNSTKSPSRKPLDHLQTSFSSTPPQIEKFASPTPGQRHIIFIESSCVVTSENLTNQSDRLIRLKTRQACAIESAARTNPDATIYLFYTCPLDGGSLSRSSELTRRVLQLPNVRVWHQSMSSFFEGTPLEELYNSGKMNKSRFPREHASDVLRLIALWKYGGTYLDIDFIVRRSFDALGQNFACAETNVYVANGVLSFSANGVGRTIVDACVNQLRSDFRGDVFNYNGPALITRVLKKQCNTKNTTLMTPEVCHGFTVLPAKTFFPVLYNYLAFFDVAHSDAVMATMQDSYAVHLWGHMIKGKTRIGTKQPLVRLQMEFCPISYSLTPDQSESK